MLVDRRLGHLRGRQRRLHRGRAVHRTGPDVQVQTVVQRVDGVLGRAVVGQHEPVETPLVLEDVVQQVLVLAGVGAVDPGIGTHHRPHATVHGRLERRQIQLPQRALVHAGVHGQPRAHQADPDREPGHGDTLALLVVHRVVLDVADHPLRLHPAGPACGHPPGQERVLPEVLERAPVQRGAQQIDRRGVDHVVALVPHLVADHPRVPPGHPVGERRRHRHRRRHAGGLPLPRSDRPVTEMHRREVDPLDAVAGAGVRALIAEHPGRFVPGQQRDLLVQRQFPQQQPGALVRRQRRVAPRMPTAPPLGGDRRRRRHRHHHRHGRHQRHHPGPYARVPPHRPSRPGGRTPTTVLDLAGRSLQHPVPIHKRRHRTPAGVRRCL